MSTARLCIVIGAILGLGLGAAGAARAQDYGLKVFDQTRSVNVSGYCGSAVVRLIGVDPDGYGTKFDTDGRIIVRTHAGGKLKELDLNTTNWILSDHNRVRCVPTRNGNRLVVWSNCAGSACGDDGSYAIIDVDRGTILKPNLDTKPGQAFVPAPKEMCDAACAERLLGVRAGTLFSR